MLLLVVPAKKKQDDEVNDKETQQAIGKLIRTARIDRGESQAAFAKHADINPKTLWSAETGDRLPQDVNQRKIERALGWRAGSIADIWADRAELTPGLVVLAKMQDGAGEATWHDLDKEDVAPLTKAMHLSDEELLAELSYRFRNYKNLTTGRE